jgi:hypothetical protein
MSQGDTVTIDIGEKVEAVFQLDCKPGDLTRLPDGDRFAELTFLMNVPARQFRHVTHQRGGRSPHADPPFVTVAGGVDDAVVRVIFSFVGNDAGGQSRFRSGDSVDLSCFYQSADFEPASDEPVFLGTVHIK